MKTIGLIIAVAYFLLIGTYSFAVEQNSAVKSNAQKATVQAPPVQTSTTVIVKCPPKAGVKTYGDSGWTGVDHANAYVLLSNNVYGNRMFCTYSGPQGFNFDLSLFFTYKNCVASPSGIFECQK